MNAVVTQFKFKARQYPQQIWAGPIVLPKSALQQVAEGISAMTHKPRVPQISMFLLALPGEALGLESGKEYLMIQAYDALGEQHARSDQGFKWAMDIPGAQVWGQTTTLREYAISGGERIDRFFEGVLTCTVRNDRRKCGQVELLWQSYCARR